MLFCLLKTLCKAFATFEEVQTVLCEIEVSINKRSLAYVSDDDLDEAPTQNHLMHGRNINERSAKLDFVHGIYTEQSKRRVLHIRKLFKDCWSHFKSHYLN